MKKQIVKKIAGVSQASLSQKQSVRTTFKLSENSNNALDWLIETSTLKPKEIFDLMSSNQNIVDSAIEIAKKTENSSSETQNRKTFVISKRVLSLLNRLSDEHKLPRDLIVDSLISFFKKVLEEHTEKERIREEEALKIISDLDNKLSEAEKQINDLLDDDNPIISRFGFVQVVLWNLINAIESKLDQNIPIDPDDMSQNC